MYELTLKNVLIYFFIILFIIILGQVFRENCISKTIENFSLDDETLNINFTETLGLKNLPDEFQKLQKQYSQIKQDYLELKAKVEENLS